jgi:uncharacterized protein YhbP (UPF0306 family)
MSALSRIVDFLARHNTLTLATIGPEGDVHAAAVFYAHAPDLRLIFLSEPGSRHCQHIASHPQVAVTIHADGQRWQHITGVQLHGRAEMAGPDARDIYLARFPFVYLARTGPLARAMKKVEFYQIVPTWIRLIDNRLGFGHKEEFDEAAIAAFLASR